MSKCSCRKYVAAALSSVVDSSTHLFLTLGPPMNACVREWMLTLREQTSRLLHIYASSLRPPVTIQDRRKEIFDRAEGEISELLTVSRLPACELV